MHEANTYFRTKKQCILQSICLLLSHIVCMRAYILCQIALLGFYLVNFLGNDLLCLEPDEFSPDAFFVHLCVGVTTEEDCLQIRTDFPDSGYHWHTDNEECRGLANDDAVTGECVTCCAL